MASDEALYNTLFNGAYLNPIQPLWAAYTSTNISGPDLAVSTLTVNPYTAGNILLQSDTVSGTEYRAPLIFQRPVGDINAPSESLQMNLSVDVPTYPVDGEFITATKAGGTAYDDLAVKGIQIFGDQTTSGNSGAIAYITGDSGGNLVLAPKESVYISSLQVSSLQVVNVISTTAGVANSYTATLFMSTPIINTGAISSSQISTNTITAVTGNFSTINVSTLNAPNFVASTLSTIFIDTKVTLTSTLTLLGVSSVSLGLGDVIQGLVGGAASQGLGAVLGGAALATGAAALITARTSGGVNSNIFQTVNGSTQLQFSTIGTAVSSVFLTTDSALPLTTPGVPIRQEIGVPAGTLCIRSVGDPLNIINNFSAIQMFGQWVPVPGGGSGSNFTIPSSIFLSTVNVNGNLTQSGTGTFNWGGNTMSPTQVVLARPTSVNATLTTTGGAFLNAGATVNSGLTVASGNLTVNNNLFTLGVLQGATVQATGSLSVGNGGISVANGGIQIAAGNFNMTSGASVANITNVNVSQNLIANQLVRTSAISTTNISTNNINVFTINNQTYPPPSGPTSIPSTLQASTITFNGGLTNIGSDPITTNTINTTNANVNFYVGNAINAASISTTTISTNTVFAGTITTNTMNTTTTNANNIQAAAMSTNTLSTNTVRAAAVSSFMISSANGVITNLNVSSVNGATYPPGGSGGIPSTLQASTITFNGGLSNIASAALFSGQINANNINNTNTITSVNVYGTNIRATDINLSNNGGNIDGGGQLSFQLAPGASKHTFRDSTGTNTGFIAEFYANKTSRFFSTVTVRDTTWPIIGPSFARLQTYDPSYDSQPWGQVLTSNVSTTTAQFNTGFTTLLNAASISSVNTSAINMGASTITASNINTLTMSASNINTLTMSASNINISSINNAIYPPTVALVPVGAITIWAGGSDTGAGQNFNIPSGWFVCNGSEQDKLIYANLYGVIGDKYAMNRTLTGTNFYLPDLTFAVPMGTPLRNYIGSNILSAPSFRCTVQTWPSDFSPFINASTQTWKVTQTVGGTLNYGSFFPANAISQPGYPSVYVKQILSYDGNVGYIVVQSVNNSNIPQTLGTIFAVGNGTVPQDSSGTYLYTLGSYGVESAYPQVTHNQAEPEVGIHTHPTGTLISLEAVDGFATTRNRSFIQYEMPNAPNQFSTISTVGYTNVGTYTAPNFINMLYIIKY